MTAVRHRLDGNGEIPRKGQIITVAVLLGMAAVTLGLGYTQETYRLYHAPDIGQKIEIDHYPTMSLLIPISMILLGTGLAGSLTRMKSGPRGIIGPAAFVIISIIVIISIAIMPTTLGPESRILFIIIGIAYLALIIASIKIAWRCWRSA